MDLLPAAVSNNVEWCALVCGGGARDGDVWVVDGSPSRLFPDAITLAPGVPPERVAALLADRPACSVKDSYADVDLAPHGFRELFAARWIGRAPTAGADAGAWAAVTETPEFATWCAAAELPRTLPTHVPADPSVTVLTTHVGTRIVAGAIANRSGDVVGVSNVFGDDEPAVWRDLPAAAASGFPGLPLVGYERGSALDAALAAGFTDLGPLRVWERP